MKKYKVGAYLRLSKEEFKSNKKSNSIVNQKELINMYVKEHCNELELCDYYVDDGYSRTTFNRPEFKRMMLDIENNKINTIVVKDLSRLGRDYIKVGDYIENLFSSLKVRFIAINDNYDSNNEIDYVSDIIALKNLTNDYYAKDISKKIEVYFKIKRKMANLLEKMLHMDI